MNTLIQIIKEHIQYRKQIIKLAKADIIRTYRGSALGWSWAVIKPTITIFVYWFAFSVGLRAGGKVGDYPFFLWLIAGVVPWFYMGDMITGGTSCFRKYSYLVNKMKYPISTIPTFISLSHFFVNIILIGIVILLFWAFGYPPDIYLLQLPVYMLFSFLFFTLWALFASFIGAMSKDFVNLVRSFVTAIFWLSGIMWDVDTITIPWLKKFLMINPVTFLVTGFRNCFTNKIWFFDQPKRLIYFACLLVVMLILAIWSYKKLKKEISDVL